MGCQPSTRKNNIKTNSLLAKPASAVMANRPRLVPTLVLASLKLSNRCPAKLTKKATQNPSALASSGSIRLWVAANTPMCVSAALVPTAKNQKVEALTG